MAKYEVTFSCGHTETIQLYGKSSERQRRIEYLESCGMCSECYAKMREEQRAAYIANEKEEAARARAELSELALPELVGSEKQITWAEDIRAKQINEMNTRRVAMFYVFAEYILSKKIHSVRRWKQDSELKIRDSKYKTPLEELVTNLNNDHPEWRQQLLAAKYHMNKFATQMINICDAREWIETRTNTLDERLSEYISKTNFSAPIPGENIFGSDDASEPEQEPEETQIIKSENCTEPGIVQITATDSEIAIKYAKNENFRLCVKSKGYSWDSNRSVWYKQLSFCTGNPTDRIAEIGQALLLKGFAVKIEDDIAREKAISGEFDPEQTRWIYKNCIDNTECIVIGINFGENDLYNSARRIKGAKWKTRLGMIVPAERYDEIRDFAEHNGYSISPGAEAALTAAETLQNSIPVVKVSERKPEEPESDTLKENLETPVEVIDDLKDED